MFDSHFKEPHGRLDKLQLVAICGLMVLGATFVFSATMVTEPAAAMAQWYRQSWFRQLIWYVLGIGAATGLCFIDYRIIARWAFVVYWVTILLLIAVLIPELGRRMAGEPAAGLTWPFSSFQPSEFAKLAFILALAHFLSRPVEELRVVGNFFGRWA
jgi:rod shape determining protein RodA